MSGPCLSSSVPDRPLKPGTRRSLGGPLPRQQADRARTNPSATALRPPFTLARPWGINPSFPGLSPSIGHVIHVLLTRAPLNQTSIATYLIPCDLHVLNTPPAFVLSQNQTLRKNDLICCSVITDRQISNRDCRPLEFPLWAGSTRLKKSAQRTIQSFFSHPAYFGFAEPNLECFHPHLGTSRAGPHCQRTSFEGNKKPIGCFHRDRRFVSRPPSVVAAREAR